MVDPATRSATDVTRSGSHGGATLRPVELEADPSPRLDLWRALLRRASVSYLAQPDGRLVWSSRSFAGCVQHLFGESIKQGVLPTPLLDTLRRICELGYELRQTIGEEPARYDALHLPIFDHAGVLRGVAGVFEPTPEKAPALRGSPELRIAELEAALEEAEARSAELESELAEARAAEQRKAAFVAEMSHELRTPLNAIIGFADMALQQIRGPLPATYRGYLEDIRGASAHLSELVESLLDIARLEGGHIPLALRPVSARLLVNEARSLVALRAEQEHVDISQVALNGDFLLEVDPIRARQIFVNLLSNAIKFTPAGGAIGVEAQPLEEDFVDIAVWDTGIGIAPSEHRRVFEAFYQVPGKGFRPSSRGAGLGLAIARQLALLMGGDILLHSEAGKGSRFTVRLKLLSAAASAGAA